jgi:radical SAM superfamily enzyme YgiQ (UPF0313 family)
VKLVLVSMPARESPEAISLGAASIAAAIRAAAASAPELASIRAVMVEARPGESPARLSSRIESERPDAVGFSVYSWNRRAFAEASRRLRSARSGLLLFAGGPEVGADPEAFIREADLDFAVAGEGESASVAALSAVFGGKKDALRDIAGIVLPGRAWRRAPPEEVGSLPSPWLLGTMDIESCGGDVAWELSRGCPFRCAYCYESKGTSGSRPFPMERIEAELDLFVKSGVRYIFVLDPTFDADPKRASLLLDLFRARAPGMRWKFEVRAELLDKALARRFAALDCGLQVGLQSIRPETLERVGRPGFDRKEFARKIAMLNQAGVSFGLDLIYGLPGDGLADFEEGLDFALGLGPNHLDLFPLALLPGTELAERAAELGIEAEREPPYLVRRTRELPPSDLAAAADLAKSADRFYTAGRAVGWFDAARKGLRIGSSALLRDFGSYLAARPERARGAGRSPDEQLSIEAEQLGFLEAAYGKSGLEKLWPALRDLVRLHGAWGRALAEGAQTVLDLSYDPEEVLGAAASGLAAFVRGASRASARWRVLPDEEEGARIERYRG